MNEGNTLSLDVALPIVGLAVLVGWLRVRHWLKQRGQWDVKSPRVHKLFRDNREDE